MSADSLFTRFTNGVSRVISRKRALKVAAHENRKFLKPGMFFIRDGAATKIGSASYTPQTSAAQRLGNYQTIRSFFVRFLKNWIPPILYIHIDKDNKGRGYKMIPVQAGWKIFEDSAVLTIGQNERLRRIAANEQYIRPYLPTVQIQLLEFGVAREELVDGVPLHLQGAEKQRIVWGDILKRGSLPPPSGVQKSYTPTEISEILAFCLSEEQHPAILNLFRKYSEQIKKILQSSSLHYVHGDLWGGNILLNPDSYRVIDFDDVRLLPAWYDFLFLPYVSLLFGKAPSLLRYTLSNAGVLELRDALERVASSTDWTEKDSIISLWLAFYALYLQFAPGCRTSFQKPPDEFEPWRITTSEQFYDSVISQILEPS